MSDMSHVGPPVELERFTFVQAQGGTATFTADQVRELLANPVKVLDDPNITQCRVCGFQAIKSGYGPHTLGHLRAIGDILPRKKKAAKVKSEPKVKAVPPPAPPTIEESCLALIYSYVGQKIPIAAVPDINVWIRDTTKLIEALK